MPLPSPDSTGSHQIERRRKLLLFVAAIIAGAGVAYELSLMLLGTITIGSTERANAIVLGTAMLGMGLGATFGGRWKDQPVTAFIKVEAGLAVLGASAAPFLYWTWARMDAFWGPLLAVSLLIGACIGAEMPLLAALNDRLSRQEAATVVANYSAADYFGALVGAVGFAFLVRPVFGIVEGTILIAVINLAAAAAVAFIVPGAEARKATAWVGAGALALVVLSLLAPPVVRDGRQALYRDPIIAQQESGVQQLVVTSRVHPGGVVDTRLFLDNDLQLSSIDEHRYHEALVHPAVSGASDVLILGGGDCLAAREALRHRSVTTITLVELDPAVVDLMRTVPELQQLQDGACDDDRLEIIHDDAFTWAGRAEAGRYDAIVVDFPDPDTPSLGRLYSAEMYGQLRDILAPDGLLVVQCGSPFFAPRAYWTCAETMEAAGFHLLPYHVDVPSFGDWGFHLASPDGAPRPSLEPIDGLRFIDDQVLAAATVFPADVARSRFDVEISTILEPTIVDAAQRAWIGYDG